MGLIPRDFPFQSPSISQSETDVNSASVIKICNDEEAYGCYLSGAGPTVIVLCPEAKTERMVQLLKALDSTARIETLSIDREGIQVF